MSSQKAVAPEWARARAATKEKSVLCKLDLRTLKPIHNLRAAARGSGGLIRVGSIRTNQGQDKIVSGVDGGGIRLWLPDGQRSCGACHFLPPWRCWRLSRSSFR